VEEHAEGLRRPEGVRPALSASADRQFSDGMGGEDVSAHAMLHAVSTV